MHWIKFRIFLELIILYYKLAYCQWKNARDMVAANNMTKLITLTPPVLIIQANLFSMILKKAGHVAIKLCMIGISLRKLLVVQLVPIVMSNHKMMDHNFSNQQLSPMLPMQSRKIMKRRLWFRISTNTMKVTNQYYIEI